MYCILLLFTGRKKPKSEWKLEYIDAVYKIYDWDKNLAGYFFPNYNLEVNNKKDDLNENYDAEDKIIERMNKEKQSIDGGNIMLPMLKLNLLDNNEGIDIDFVINSLEENIQRAKKWNQWIIHNHTAFKIFGSSVYTAREDRNMLSIVLGLETDMILGEKDLCESLKPLLNELHKDELI